MSLEGLLQGLLTRGSGLLNQGEDLAARQLGIGSDPASRNTLRQGALAGGAATAVLGMLLGTGTGRSMAGTGAMLGGIGLLGKLAYDAYRKHAGGAGAEPPGIDAGPIDALPPAQTERRADAILKAMVAAARADGEIDATERTALEGQLGILDPEARALVMKTFDTPLDAVDVAGLAENEQAGREMYAASVMVCKADSPAERVYLDRLAGALRLRADIAQQIEADVRAA